MIRNFLRKLKRNKFDILLKKAARERKKRFLILWNRGLGDIALGLYGMVFRIKKCIPHAQITFLTRKELADAFSLLAGTNVIAVPWWQRKNPIDFDDTARRLNLKQEDYDIVLLEVNPTKWLKWQIGNLIPKMSWKSDYDLLWKRLNINCQSRLNIGVHLNTETQQFYGYNKDWPLANWEKLLERILHQSNIGVLLLGQHKTPFLKHPSLIDLRGETSLLEVLSLIKNCCKILIAPDGGLLSLTYYLDVFFPITIISLWGDVHQGILKQAVPSPNKGLIHISLTGEEKDITRLEVDKVFEAVLNSIQVNQ
ncbi:MAG: hypothetical protein OEW45_06590 [Deltaproteobacteria bacterium]|nr:hypothetical protein [Deltaproteobacteria bacterium]